ncbi:zinc finger protein JACKDAW isoform X1 [Vigna radiata var. radiata]|uniref:Zinc finger protein JACKDAW isoform X1 n=1 Tax=Vigna radiata var. radiata TaxID=3916 RepID=A0A1S3TMD7_VIGRR|nr:zinc finger protein JACKDAW isoform X1 [Vigna radiata var. radiata]
MQMIPSEPFSLSSTLPGLPNEQNTNPNPNHPPPPTKKKRNLPGTPDPDAEVIALSPKTLMATNRFICEICNKGFQRDQNLQLHRRGHNLPWKLRQRSNKEVRKKVYICPEKTCVHHHASRALGDLTGIKKHYSRKHGEKKWKCEKCSKKYAVQSDWKAHTKTCGTREYKCDCGTLFSRKDSFITHRAFCDALAEESSRLSSVTTSSLNFKSEDASVMNTQAGLSSCELITGQGMQSVPHFGPHGFRLMGMGADQQRPNLSLWLNQGHHINNPLDVPSSSSSGLPEVVQMAQANNALIDSSSVFSNFRMPASNSKGEGGASDLATIYSESQNKNSISASPMSATALLQKAAQMGSTRSTNPSIFSGSFGVMSSSSTQSTSLNNRNANQTGDQLNQVFHNMNRQENFNGTSSSATMLGSSSNFSSLTHPSNSFDQFLMQNNVEPTQINLHPGSNTVEHNLTRDFLGMNRNGGGHPFLPEELAKFASLGSSMGLNQFIAGHQ